MDPVRLIAELVAQRRKARAAIYSRLSAYTSLLNAGLIEENGLVSSVICDDCSNTHDSEIVFENQRYGYFCPELGLVELDRASLIATQANMASFVAQLADDLDCKRRRSAPIAGNTWRIGAIETLAGDLVIYVQPTLQSQQDCRELEAALAHEVKARLGIILTAVGTFSIPRLSTITFEDCLGYDQSSGRFTVDADLRAVAGLPASRKGGRPNQFKERVSALIEDRWKTGHSLQGRNEEAIAVLAGIKASYPEDEAPSLSTIKRYVSEFRAGS